jgi:hypothetical protein
MTYSRLDLILLALKEIEGEIANDIRPCPNCRIFLKRTEGCPFMKCDGCKSAHCLFCGTIMNPEGNSCNEHECDKQAEMAERALGRVRENNNAAKNGKSIRFHVNVNGATQTIVLPETAVVGDIKQAIFLKASIVPARQKLQYSGKNLQPDCERITNFGIVQNSTVTLVVDTRGGLDMNA